MSAAAHMEHPFPQRKFSVIALEKLAVDSDDSGLSATDDTPSPTEFSEMGDMDTDNVAETSLYPFSSASFDNDPATSWKPLYPTDQFNFGPDSLELTQALQDLSDPSTEPFKDSPISFPGAVGPYGYPIIPWEEYLGEGYHNQGTEATQNWAVGPQQPIETASPLPPPPIPSHPILSLPAAPAFKDIDFYSSGNMDWLLSLTSQPNSSQFPVSRYQSDLFPVPSSGPVAQPNIPQLFRSVPVMFPQQQSNSNSNAAVGGQQSPQAPQFTTVNTPNFYTQPQTPPATPKFGVSGEAYDASNSDTTNDLNRRFSMWPDYQEDEMLEEQAADGTLSPGWRDAGSCVETALSISPSQYDPSNLPEFSPFYFGDGHDGYPGLPPMPHYPTITWADQ